MKDPRFFEPGRRVKAAVISYVLGRTGVDYTLKEVPEDPGEFWVELGKKLFKGITQQLGDETYAALDKLEGMTKEQLINLRHSKKAALKSSPLSPQPVLDCYNKQFVKKQAAFVLVLP